MKTKLLLALLGFVAAVPCSSHADEEGRYKAFPGEYLDSITVIKQDEKVAVVKKVEVPGVWLLDSETGRIAFCENNANWTEPREFIGGPEGMFIVQKHLPSSGVSCTAWAVPEREGALEMPETPTWGQGPPPIGQKIYGPNGEVRQWDGSQWAPVP